MAYELDEPFAALMSSSARHSAIDLTLRNADSRVCVLSVSNGAKILPFVLNETYAGSQECDSLVDSSER